MDRKAFQDLLHLTDAERSALTDRLTRAPAELPGGGKERRRDRRSHYVHSGIPIAVEHPGGGISRYLVWSRNLSAGGISFLHGGFLHQGSRCKIQLTELSGQSRVVGGTVVSCRLASGRNHEVGVKFDQRI